MDACPVCGKPAHEGYIFGEYFEEETFVGEYGASMKIVLPYCNAGSDCNAVLAANVMDDLAEPFLDLVRD